MSHTRKSFALILILAAALALPAVAEHHETGPTGYLGDFVKDFDFSNGRILELAEAIPADKYGWRPAEGIRSVSEVIVHVAGANFFFASQFGVAMPEGFSRDAEKTVTAKADVIALLKSSQKHIHKAAKAAAEVDLDEMVNLFGSERSRRGILMIVSGHGHEHLGQAIAYARSNGIAPPWSQPQPAAAEEGEEGEEG
jgi:uncharacterized damage-inducible protein DinB